MTTAIAVAAALAFSFALGSLIRQVDGAKLRRWRLSRRWDVSRLAREFIAAADEPPATLCGLAPMIKGWGARRPHTERAVLAAVPPGLPRVRERRDGNRRPGGAGAPAP